jgi:putative ABC transport system permease protein
MKKWLLNFAYKTEVNIWIFIVSGLIAFSIAILTINLHAYRTAHLNPANSLRYE